MAAAAVLEGRMGMVRWQAVAVHGRHQSLHLESSDAEDCRVAVAATLLTELVSCYPRGGGTEVRNRVAVCTFPGLILSWFQGIALA